MQRRRRLDSSMDLLTFVSPIPCPSHPRRLSSSSNKPTHRYTSPTAPPRCSMDNEASASRTATPAEPESTELETPPVAPDPKLIRIRRALISVSDKNQVVGLAKSLVERGVEIISTGGTFRHLQEAGVPVRGVQEYTEFPEMMDGRVKTLHPRIHGGLLAIRDNDEHMVSMEEHGVLPIDLLVVNLYPFERTVRAGAPFSSCVGNIDVGGPSMVRAAAKNYKFVTVITDERQYFDLMAELEENDGSTTRDLRLRMASAAFSRLAAYDAAVANRFAIAAGSSMPDTLLIPATRKENLRYGENPHQDAAFYTINYGNSLINVSPGVSTAEQIQGKSMSYNNIADTDAAFELVSEFPDSEPVCAIIKHSNPCGVAKGVTPQDAYLRALASDPVSAFGGIVAMNVPLDKHSAEEIAKVFTEVVIAPDASTEALAVLSKKKNLRVLLTGSMPAADESGLQFKSVRSGVLVQTRDNGTRNEEEVKVVSKREPTKEEMEDLLFAWRVCKHVKSNAIVYAKKGATVGTGAGQMSRVDASRIAAWKAQEASTNAEEEESRTQGCVVASDAFFPFADGLIAAADAGATAVIQPGGSKRDAEVLEAADERNIAVVFTGMRHFKH